MDKVQRYIDKNNAPIQQHGNGILKNRTPSKESYHSVRKSANSAGKVSVGRSPLRSQSPAAGSSAVGGFK